MKKLITLSLIAVAMISCDGKAGELKKNMHNDVNDLCKCTLDIMKGENIAECGKKQEEIRAKYKEHNDLLIELDEKVKVCIDDNQ
jgi:hypothetical protein